MAEVYKFGGTSVDHLELIAEIIIKRKNKNPFTCVSAFSGTTDLLLKIVKQAEEKKELKNSHLEYLLNWHLTKILNASSDLDLVKKLQRKLKNFWENISNKIAQAYIQIQKKGPSPFYTDIIMGCGEQVAAFILAETISLKGKQGKFIDLSQIIKTNNKLADQKFFDKLKEKIKTKLNKIDEHSLPIITGFIGEVPQGILNSISRGYTDYTGAFISSIIQAKKYIIFKEVDGLCSADPRIIGNKFILLKKLSYLEVLKMASGGMKAVNMAALKPAMSKNITIEVRNTFSPSKKGTTITAERKIDPQKKIQNITVKRNVCIIRFGGFDEESTELEFKLLKYLKKHHIKKFFSTSDLSGSSVVLLYEKEKIEKLMTNLNHGRIKIIKNCSIIAIVGEEMQGRIGVLAKACRAIAQSGASIYVTVQGASQIGIDFVIDEEFANQAVINLHESFFEE